MSEKEIVFDGTEESAILIRSLLYTVSHLVPVHYMGNSLHIGGLSYEAGTTFDVVLPDEIIILMPSAVKKIDVKFKLENWSWQRYRK